MEEVIIPYNECENLIKDADVLLFRYPKFPRVGWWVAIYTGGIHSHVGMAHWDEDVLECIEFREFRGGRSVALKSQIGEAIIDVFRPINSITQNKLVTTYGVDGKPQFKIDRETKKFTPFVADNITKTMRNLTGLPYGWKIIFKLGKAYLPGVRLWYRLDTKDDNVTDVYVCSTSIAYSFRKHYVDLCPYLADGYTKPCDIARSPILQYMFTIGPN